MHGMRKVRKKGKPLPPRLKGGLFLLSALFLGVSLFTYTDGDPRENWLGLTGHITGWSFSYLLGFSSWLLPVFLGWVGVDLVQEKAQRPLAARAPYFTLLLLSFCLLLALTADTFPSLGRTARHFIYSGEGMRHYLGGVPLHYLVNDIHFNLQRLLGKMGILACSIGLGCFALSRLLHIPVAAKIKKLGRFIKQKIPPLLPAPERRRPFQRDDGATQQDSAATQTLLREDPLKKQTQIRIVETNARKPHAITLKPLVSGDYTIPPSSLLTEVPPFDQSSLKNDLKRQAKLLEETLLSFGIEAKVGDIHCGPTITSFEVHPAVGVKVQKIKTLESDIALNLQAKSIRIIAPIPGKAAVGIEVPNLQPQEVSFRDLLECYQSQKKAVHIPLLLGKMVNGDNIWADLTKMPHLIIAGATGSGKSVCINTIVMSIVMNARPDDIKLLMVDPKKVELTAYTHLPHMLTPVITEPGGACSALGWLVKEMERRYEIFRQLGIRNVHGFNTRKINKELEDSLELNIPEKLSFIVVIIDELADLMMVSSSDIETPIARIAQMARAVGIHMILATQRPSREVITGLIKANFPCRIAFKVSSRINSQIIIDDNGAEMLLGNGDMLFLPPGTSTLCRAQGAFIRDDDINRVIHFCCSQASTHYLIPSFDNYREGVLSQESSDPSRQDPLYDEAKKMVLETGNASTTFLQRKMKIGYARAASLMDLLEHQGVVGPSEGAKPRKIYYPEQNDVSATE